MRVPPVCVCMVYLSAHLARFSHAAAVAVAAPLQSDTTINTGSVFYSTSPSPYSYCSFYFICYSLLLLPLLLNSLSSFLPHSLTKPLNACCAAICHKFSLCCSPTALPALLLCCDCGNCHSALQPTSPSLSSSSAPSPSLCVLLLML